jgi:hypothetical protein
MKLGMYIMAPESISAACNTNPSYQSVCPIVANKRFGKYVFRATNTHATIKQLLKVSFSIRSVSYVRKVVDLFFLEDFAFL